MAVITASPSNFMKLLDLQQKSLEHVETIRNFIEVGRNDRLDEKQLKTLEKISKTEDEMVVVAKETKEIQRSQKELAKKSAEQAAVIASMAESIDTFKTMGDNFKESMERITKPFSSMSSFKESLLKKVNFGGIANKAIAREQFIQQQRKLGSEKTDKELRQDFEVRNTAAKEIKKNEAEIEKFRKETGLSEAQIGKTDYGMGLLNKRKELAAQFAPTDLKTKFAGDEEGDSEAAIEQQKMAEENLEVQRDQHKTLERIETYLKPSDAKPSADKSSGGGGMLSGLAKGLKVLGPAIAKFGGAAGTGILLFFEGLGKGLAALASPVTLLGLGAFTLAMMGVGKALEMAAPAFEAIAPVLMKVAEVIGTVFVKAIENIPATLKAVGDVITAVGGGIATVITAIADSIVKVVDAVRRLFGIGSDNSGAEKAKANVTSKVGAAVKNMATSSSSDEDPNVKRLEDEIENANSPAEAKRARMRLRVYRAKQGDADAVNQASAENAGASQGGSGGGNTVVAPVTTNNTQVAQNVFKMPTRNNDTSYGRYMRYLNDY